MKKIYLIITIGIVILALGCRKLDNDNEAVNGYVSALKEGTFHSYDLPEFSEADIPALLYYRNDTTTINRFPVNPISSFMMTKCSLGMIMLWSVESVRVTGGGNSPLIGRFPSQNPILASRIEPGKWFSDSGSQFAAAEAYYKWWTGVSLNNRMKTDPLEGTKYVWH
jgi:hypothetical protein